MSANVLRDSDEIKFISNDEIDEFKLNNYGVDK